MKNIEINLQNLEQNKFLRGDLFWNKKSGKKVLLSLAGNFVDEVFVKKLLEKNEKLEMTHFGNDEFQNNLRNILENLKTAKFENERVEVRECLIEHFRNSFKSQNHFSGLDLVAPLMDTMYEVKMETENVFLERNSDLYLRELFIASVLVCMSIEAGYMDFNFLKNIFNSELIVNYFLAESRVGIFHLEELEKNRIGEFDRFPEKSLMYRLADYGSRASSKLEGEDIYRESLGVLCEFTGRRVDPAVSGDILILKNVIEEQVSYLNIDIKEIDLKEFRKSILANKSIAKLSSIINYTEAS